MPISATARRRPFRMTPICFSSTSTAMPRTSGTRTRRIFSRASGTNRTPDSTCRPCGKSCPACLESSGPIRRGHGGVLEQVPVDYGPRWRICQRRNCGSTPFDYCSCCTWGAVLVRATVPSGRGAAGRRLWQITSQRREPRPGRPPPPTRRRALVLTILSEHAGPRPRVVTRAVRHRKAPL